MRQSVSEASLWMEASTAREARDLDIHHLVHSGPHVCKLLLPLSGRLTVYARWQRRGPGLRHSGASRAWQEQASTGPLVMMQCLSCCFRGSCSAAWSDSWAASALLQIVAALWRRTRRRSDDLFVRAIERVADFFELRRENRHPSARLGIWRVCARGIGLFREMGERSQNSNARTRLRSVPSFLLDVM